MSAPTAPTFADDDAELTPTEIVRALHTVRQRAQAAEVARLGVEAEVKRVAENVRSQYPDVYREAAEAKAEEGRLYGLLRSAAVAAYENGGTKSPLPGTTVKVTKDWDFDRTEALAFAKRTGMFLTLDKPAFEAFAKSQVTKAQLAQVEEDGELKADVQGVLVTVTARALASVSKDLAPVVQQLDVDAMPEPGTIVP